MISALESLDVSAAEWLAGCDPALTHLPDAMGAAEPHWTLHDVQWSPGQGCRLAYQVDVEGSGTSTFVGFSLDAQTWSSHDFRDDPSLPGLSSAADPTRVSDELRLTVEEPILHCRVQPVRYRPTSRCVLRYDVRTASGLSPYFAKVFSRTTFADASRRATQISAAAHPTRLRVSRVVGVWPELYTTVSVAADGRSASSMLRDVSLSAQSRIDLAERLGELLADLHALPGVPVPVRTASDHLRAVADLMPSVRLLDPPLADRLRRLLDRLERALPPRDHEDVLIHGAFRPGQVVVDDAGLLHLLDLDGVSRGDAHQDLGTALAHLSWAAIRQPSSGVQPGDLDQALLAGYGAHGIPVRRASLIWWRAAVLAQIAARRFRRLDVADWPVVPQLIDLAETLIAGRTGSVTS